MWRGVLAALLIATTPALADPPRWRVDSEASRLFFEATEAGRPVRGEFRRFDADIAFADIKEEEYAGIFFSGGRAPEYIRYDEDLMRVTKYFFAENKPVASVCHGVPYG